MNSQDQQEAYPSNHPSQQQAEMQILQNNLKDGRYSQEMGSDMNKQQYPSAGHIVYSQAQMSQPGAGTMSNQQFPQDQNIMEQSVQQEQPFVNEPEDFYLMDIVGGGCVKQANVPSASKSVAVMHPTKPVIAYSAGCMIIVYDLLSDCKINLVGHQHDVHAIAFTPNGETLLSIDFNRNAELQDLSGAQQEPTSNINFWDWQRGISIQETAIPRSQNLSMMLAPTQGVSGLSQLEQTSLLFNQGHEEAVCHIQISFDKSGSLFMVLESSPLKIGGGYRVTLWSLMKTNVVEMISSMELELQSPCIDIAFLPRQQSDILAAQRSAGQNNHSAQMFLNQRLPFLTLERNCIKLWEYSQGNAQLNKRIHIKQNIVSFKSAEITGFFLILGENGKLLILDSQGEFISTVQKEGAFFTQLGIAHDKLLLGTNRGTVHVYHIASLQFISEIPYQLSFLQKFSLNIDQSQRDEQLSLGKLGPPVTLIQLTQNLRFLWIQYSDGSFAVVDRTLQNPRQAILGYSCGHFESISGLQWISQRNIQFSPSNYESSTGENQYTADQQFITCGYDLSVHVWKHYGDRWAFSYIDVAKCFDQCLSFQRKQCDRSTKDLQLTALCLYPKSNNLIVSDNKGYVRIFQLVNNSAHLIATHRLQRSPVNQTEGSEQASLISADQDSLENDSIKKIYVTNNENIAVITFNSGLISFYDIKNSYTFIGDIENCNYSKFNTMSSISNAAIQTQVIEVSQQNTSFSRNGGNFAQDEQPIKFPDAQRSQYNGSSNIYGGYSSSLKVISLTTPNQVSMQLVDIKGSKVSKSNLCQYVITEGKVTGFDIHPSKDYLLVTSSKGRVYVFRIDTGELRGTVRIPLNASGCEIDPSGLYFIVKVPAFANQNAVNLVEGQSINLSHFGANEKELTRNTILMYEIGTGQPAAEINSVFQITEMKFSVDGRFLTLGSSCGAVSVWAMGVHIHQNIKQVIDAMKLSNDFWFNYPIFLPDYEVFSQNAFVDVNVNPPEGQAAQSNNFVRPPQRRSGSNFQQTSGQQTGQVFTPQGGAQLHPQLMKNTDNTRSNEQSQQQIQYPQYTAQSQPQFMGQNQYARQPLPQYDQNYGQPPVNNERRFMRSQKQTHQMMHPVTHGNYEINQPLQSFNQQLINSQRLNNSGLYQTDRLRQGVSQPYEQNAYNNQWLRPTSQTQLQYQQVAPQQQQWQPQPPQYNNNRNYMNMQDPGMYTDKSTDRNLAAFQQTSNPDFAVGEQYGDRNQFQQQQVFQPIDQTGQQTQSHQSMIPYYPPQQQQVPNQQHRSGLSGNQDQAAATLLGYPENYNQQHNYTLGNTAQQQPEPVPFNQSQLLYSQPMNATINRQEPSTINTQFIQYKDLSGAKPANNTTPPRFGTQQLTQIPGDLQNTQTPQRNFDGTLQQFDKSLNDRVAFTMKSTNVHLNEVLNQTINANTQDQSIAAPRQSEASNIVQKVNPNDFKPVGFSNTLTNDALLKRTLKKDPSDIDENDSKKEKVVAQDQDNFTQLNELDGMNKYLQNVKVPSIFNKQDQPLSYTLKNFRKEERNAVKSLYAGAAPANIPSYGVHADPRVNVPSIPLGNRGFRQFDGNSQNSSQFQKASNHDVIDEMYQNIDDFESKLKISKW